MFVSRCFHDAGLPLPASSPKGFAWTPSGVAWFKQQGRWYNGTAGIAAGDVVFFDFQTGDTFPVDHVGIVESVNADGSFNTIEGNTSNQVMRHRRNACKGYGRPAWHVAPPQPSDPEEFTVDAEARKAFDDVIRRLDQDHLPLARDTNAWVKAKAAGAPVDLAAAIAALGDDIARQVADELVRRLAS
jgi:hypothetical protein